MIKTPEIAELAVRARTFLSAQSWCDRVEAVELAWGVAGILAIFVVKVDPRRADIPKSHWVIIGDIPPAYLLYEDNPTWREALEGYVREMELWVGAVRTGGPLDDVIPVNVPPTREWAEELAGRLAFIRTEILATDAEVVESDT